MADEVEGADTGKDTARGERKGETPGRKGRIDRARLARVFGEVLPETTRDEREPGEERSESDEWLRRQVPPHHGRV